MADESADESGEKTENGAKQEDDTRNNDVTDTSGGNGGGGDLSSRKSKRSINSRQRSQERSNQVSTRKSREKSRDALSRKSINSSEATFGDDEWSDLDKEMSHYYNSSPTQQRPGTSDSCSCIPNISSPGIPSMLYDKVRCKHLGLTGHAHKNVQYFQDNWTNSGKLPPIHATNFISWKKPAKYSGEYCRVRMGYPVARRKRRNNNVSDDEADEADEQTENKRENNEEARIGDEDVVQVYSKPRVLISERYGINNEELRSGYIEKGNGRDSATDSPSRMNSRRIARRHQGTVYNPAHLKEF